MKHSLTFLRVWLVLFAAMMGLAAMPVWGGEICVDLDGNGKTSDPGECVVLNSSPSPPFGNLPEEEEEIFPVDLSPEMPEQGQGRDGPVSR